MKPMHKKILIAIGTRPEAIKCAPLILELKNKKNIKLFIYLSPQHPKISKETLAQFDIKATHISPATTYDDLHKRTQHFYEDAKKTLKTTKPDLVIIQGDTSSAYTMSLASHQYKTPIAHIEAGLRTHTLLDPYPEEFHRKSISHIAQYHFCPTENNKKNLVSENIINNLYVVGNPVLDAAIWMQKQKKEIQNSTLKSCVEAKKHFVFITVHRRENWGENFYFFCNAIQSLASKNPSLQFLFASHPNNTLHQHPACNTINNLDNVKQINPLCYSDCLTALKHSQLTISDSGGLQEEITLFSTPLLVFRDSTERPEALNTQVYLSNKDTFLDQANHLLKQKKTTHLINASIFGDGKASKQIAKHLDQILKETTIKH